MKEYVKKPVKVQVYEYEEIVRMFSEGVTRITLGDGVINRTFEGNYYICTLEGSLKLTSSDFIIVGVEGEIYPIRKDIFYKTYEPLPVNG